MRSLINWALLALVIQRPSYAYELAQRFARIYDGVLPLASTSHIYSALDVLTSRSLVEELAGSREARQPRPHYRATELGLREFEAWLVAQVQEGRRRQRLLILQLMLVKRQPDAANILDRYEQAWQEASTTEDNAGEDDSRSECIRRLLAQEQRLTTDANLSWVTCARSELEKLNG